MLHLLHETTEQRLQSPAAISRRWRGEKKAGMMSCATVNDGTVVWVFGQWVVLGLQGGNQLRPGEFNYGQTFNIKKQESSTYEGTWLIPCYQHVKMINVITLLLQLTKEVNFWWWCHQDLRRGYFSFDLKYKVGSHDFAKCEKKYFQENPTQKVQLLLYSVSHHTWRNCLILRRLCW